MKALKISMLCCLLSYSVTLNAEPNKAKEHFLMASNELSNNISTCLETLNNYLIASSTKHEVKKCITYFRSLSSKSTLKVISQGDTELYALLNILLEQYLDSYLNVAQSSHDVIKYRENLTTIINQKEPVLSEINKLTNYLVTYNGKNSQLYMYLHGRSEALFNRAIDSAENILNANVVDDRTNKILDQTARDIILIDTSYKNIINGSTKRRIPKIQDKKAQAIIVEINKKIKPLTTSLRKVLEVTPEVYRAYSKNILSIDKVVNEIEILLTYQKKKTIFTKTW